VVDLLDSWGYRGWVLPGPAWQPLDGFDLTAHQRATEGAVRRGLVLRSVSSLPRHVSSVLFTPQEGPGPAGLPG